MSIVSEDEKSAAEERLSELLGQFALVVETWRDWQQSTHQTFAAQAKMRHRAAIQSLYREFRKIHRSWPISEMVGPRRRLREEALKTTWALAEAMLSLVEKDRSEAYQEEFQVQQDQFSIFPCRVQKPFCTPVDEGDVIKEDGFWLTRWGAKVPFGSDDFAKDALMRAASHAVNFFCLIVQQQTSNRAVVVDQARPATTPTGEHPKSPDQIQDAIMRLLKAKNPYGLTLDDLVDKLGYARPTVNSRVQKLKAQDLIANDRARGGYFLTDAGVQLVAKLAASEPV